MDASKKEELNQKWKTIATRAVTDEDFKESLIKDPITIMREHGLEVPEGTEAKVGTGKVHKLIFPKDISAEIMEEVKWWTWRLDMVRDFGKDDTENQGRHISMTNQEDE